MRGIAKMGSEAQLATVVGAEWRRILGIEQSNESRDFQGPSKLRVYDSKILAKKKKLGQRELGQKISAVTHGKE